MAESKELKKIKKLYGEKFMHLCRAMFPTLLEQEGLLTKILESTFSTNSRTLCEDILSYEVEEEFKDFIYSKVDVEKKKPELITKKTPYELLDEAGYDLYECTSEEEIQNFKKYYSPGEALCTFSGGRLDRCVVFWAVRKDAEKIKREDFQEPKREDEYGTSVMGIQFSKNGVCTVSIKNRYNHTVNNPDATYGNDLDRIVPGLSQSFAELLSERGLEFNSANRVEFELYGYTVAGDGKYYKYNNEINGIFYCPGNIIIDHGKVIQLEPEKQVLVDCFIIDKTNKTIKLYDESIGDSFIDAFEDIEKIEMKRSEEKKGDTIITITQKNSQNPITIVINKKNQIVGYENQDLTNIGNNFLSNSNQIKRIILPNVKKIGNDVCCVGTIEELNLDSLETTGNNCFVNCEVDRLNMPKLRHLGNHCFVHTIKISELDLPSLERIGNDCFSSFGLDLQRINLPQLSITGNNFCKRLSNPHKINIPNIEQFGDDCLSDTLINLRELSFPKLKKVGNNFLNRSCLEKLDLPLLEQTGDYFLCQNSRGMNIGLTELRLPRLKTVGDGCLDVIRNLDIDEDVDLSSLERIGDSQSLFNGENLVTIVAKNSERKNMTKRGVTSKEIARLDTDSQITTTEVSWAQKFVDKIKSIFRKKDKNEREK